MITLINNHVLFPHSAEWSQPPAQTRNWESELSEALPGQETRQALRACARRSLTINFFCASLQERSRFDARWDAAISSGFACAPMFGRQGQISANANVGATSLTVSSPSWTWAVGDYAILKNGDTMFDVAKVTAIAGAVLTLASALAYSWPSDWDVWPLIFGRPTSDQANIVTSWHEAIPLTITQLIAERTVQLGAVVPPAGSGIGVWSIGSNFVVT